AGGHVGLRLPDLRVLGIRVLPVRVRPVLVVAVLVVAVRAGPRGGGVLGRGGYLVEEVYELLYRADEVAGRQAGDRVEDVFELGGAGPTERRPHRAPVRAAQERQAAALFQLVEFRPGTVHRGQHVADRAL